MHRVPHDHPVRRCLFPDDLTDQARADNFTNESHEEQIEKMRKWNFDFKNEVPLEGAYQWSRWNGTEWIDMHPNVQTPDEDVPKGVDSFIPMQTVNEATPKGSKDEEMPMIRKRKQDINSHIGDKDVKRSICFD